MFCHRSELEVMKDILITTASNAGTNEEEPSGANKKYMMDNAVLSYKQLKSYLGLLIRKNFIRKEKNIFITTEKGLEFLEKYHNLKPLVE